MTIKDIAKESGYAVGTVSRVLNNQKNVSIKAREKILAVVNKYGFEINSNAKNLKQQCTKNIAVLVKGASNIFFAKIVEYIQDIIMKEGYYVITEYIDEDENEVEKALTIIRENKPLGIIFLSGVAENFVNDFSKINIPCVLTTNSAKKLGFSNLSSVSISDSKASSEAINYLISCGHTSIGIIGGNPLYSEISKYRLEGVMHTFNKNNIIFDKDNNFEKARFSYKSAYKAMGRLLNKNSDITAIFTMSDVMAIGAMRACSDRNLKIPEDISIIGFDGLELTEYTVPRLTTINQDEQEMAVNSVKIIIDMIENRSEAIHKNIKFELRLGDSVKNI